MEEKTTSIWKSTFMSGLYLAIVLILVSVVFYVTGNTFSKVAQYLSYVVMIAGIIYGQVNYRKALGGTMTYTQALGAGVLVMVFASFLTGIYTLLLYNVIDPSLKEQLRIYTEEQITKKRNLSEEQIQAALNFSSKFQTPTMMFIMGIFGGAFGGLIISLITSIFIKKNPTDEVPE